MKFIPKQKYQCYKLFFQPVSSEMLLNKARFCSNNFRHNNHNMNGPPTQMDMNFKTARNPFNKWKAVPNRRFMLPHQQNNVSILTINSYYKY